MLAISPPPFRLRPKHLCIVWYNNFPRFLKTKQTDLGNANWAPFFHPSGKKVIFSSNHKSKRGFPFNLFMINLDGTGLEQITYDTAFDSFPMFSFDGKKLIFASNRNNNGTRDTNLFLADWVD